ncbi:MAG TPA: MarR family winged helix-turn-helix transcriptional regulator [Caldimonas sp.]
MSTDDRLVPRGCTSFKLRQLTRRVSQHYDHVVGECGLKTTQYSLLSQIERLAPVRPSDLAAAMAMDASTLTRNLQPLIEHGWARVGPGADGRSRLVVLTARGRVKRAEAQRAWKRAQLTLNERLGSDRVAALHALLDSCLADLSEPETSDA